jgi:arylsulfatase A-like enzyme
VLALYVICALAAQCGSSPPHPSIVLITIDTLRADHLGCYGYFRETSPGIDALAGEGILFERAYAPMSTTLPSHVSLMTSLNPLQHGVQGNFMHLRTALTTSDELHTAAQIFARMGYTTAAFISCTPLKSHSGIAAGFEVYGEPERLLRAAKETTDAALEWLAENEQRPVFLWLHYFDPHQPYEPPAEFKDSFTGTKGLRRFLKDRGVQVNERLIANNNQYDGSILSLDSQLQRLFGELKTRGLYDSSAIVFTADHGEGLGQHGWVDHGPIYEEDIHVPLIIKLPGASSHRGERRTDLAALIDVLPTLVGALDLPISDQEHSQFTGRNLLGGGSEREYVFSQRVARERRWGPGLKYALTGTRWKYYHLTEGEDELYDLGEDPAELENLIAEQPTLAQTMRLELLQRMKAYQNQGREAGDDTGFSPQIIEDLKSLGYAR